MRRICAISMALVLLCALLAGEALGSGITNSGDDLRTGWYPDEPSLTPQLLTGGSFGQLWSATVSGQVYAQPLLANGTLLIATENNLLYGLDPASGALKWAHPANLGIPWNAADIGCGDLAPTIGVTARIVRSTNEPVGPVGPTATPATEISTIPIAPARPSTRPAADVLKLSFTMAVSI